MLSSLRVRLPLVFLTGIVLAGLTAGLISIQLLRSYARNQTTSELRQEGRGLARLYEDYVHADFAEPKGQSQRAPSFAGADLEQETGDLIYFDGPVSPFPGENPGLTPIDLPQINWSAGRVINFVMVPPHLHDLYDAVASPVTVGDAPIGAIVIAKQAAQTGSVVDALLERIALAGLGGLLIAGALGIYLSRRLVRPVVALSEAADRIAAGDYEVGAPAGATGEIGHLAERFAQMTERLRSTELRERGFLMSVSHELRTPLTAIRGHVSALAEGVVETPEMRDRSLETVLAELGRLERLVGDILDLARLQADRFTVLREEVAMDQLLRRAYDTFAVQAQQRNIDYVLDLQSSPVIDSDGNRVLQIVDNLLSNAFAATPDGGRISLQLRQATDGAVQVAVEDTGGGISTTDGELVFRPFFSGARRGTGLGLPIARELAHALGGQLCFSSELGRGSRFELVLPRACGRLADVLRVGERRLDVGDRRQRVLAKRWILRLSAARYGA